MYDDLRHAFVEYVESIQKYRIPIRKEKLISVLQRAQQTFQKCSSSNIIYEKYSEYQPIFNLLIRCKETYVDSQVSHQLVSTILEYSKTFNPQPNQISNQDAIDWCAKSLAIVNQQVNSIINCDPSKNVLLPVLDSYSLALADKIELLHSKLKHNHLKVKALSTTQIQKMLFYLSNIINSFPSIENSSVELELQKIIEIINILLSETQLLFSHDTGSDKKPTPTVSGSDTKANIESTTISAFDSSYFFNNVLLDSFIIYHLDIDLLIRIWEYSKRFRDHMFMCLFLKYTTTADPFYSKNTEVRENVLLVEDSLDLLIKMILSSHKLLDILLDDLVFLLLTFRDSRILNLWRKLASLIPLSNLLENIKVAESSLFHEICVLWHSPQTDILNLWRKMVYLKSLLTLPRAEKTKCMETETQVITGGSKLLRLWLITTLSRCKYSRLTDHLFCTNPRNVQDYTHDIGELVDFEPHCLRAYRDAAIDLVLFDISPVSSTFQREALKIKLELVLARNGATENKHTGVDTDSDFHRLKICTEFYNQHFFI